MMCRLLLLLVLATGLAAPSAGAQSLSLDAQARGLTAARLVQVRQAAQKGSPSAQALLAVAYLNGQGIGHDEAQALAWAQKSAKAGNADALNVLGTLSIRGVALRGDPRAAARYFQQAVDKGSADAMSNLGALYYSGIGVTRDPKRAVDLYTRGARKGSDLAMLNLATAYADARYLKPDAARAYAWAALAADRGNGGGNRLITLLRPKMSAAQLSQAAKLKGTLLK